MTRGAHGHDNDDDDEIASVVCGLPRNDNVGSRDDSGGVQDDEILKQVYPVAPKGGTGVQDDTVSGQNDNMAPIKYASPQKTRNCLRGKFYLIPKNH